MKILLFANTDWYLFNFRRSLILALRDAGHEVLLVSPPGPYAARFADLGLRWIAAPMQRSSINPMRELAFLMWLWHMARSERPDLLHGFTIKCAVYGSLVARLAGIPARVNAVAGMGYVFTSRRPKARLLRPFVRSLMRVALDSRQSRLILQNPDDVAFFDEARLVDPGHVRLIRGSGVDCARFRPGPPERRPASSPFRVLLPARLVWDKGLSEYVGAARLLQAEGRPVDFLLAGEPDEGNPAAAPLETIRQWVDEGIVKWLGHVDDMPSLYQSVHAVVLPSYREGLPKGLIEAAACGLPLVTTDVPGCREVVQHGLTGLLVPARDAVALARAIARLQDDLPLRAKLGAAARQKALSEFDERVVIEKTMHVYEELIASS